MAVLPDEPAKPSQGRTSVGALPAPLRSAAVATRGEKRVVNAGFQELERGSQAEPVAVRVGDRQPMVLADEPLDAFRVIRRVNAVNRIGALVAGVPAKRLPVVAAGTNPAAREDCGLRRDESHRLRASGGSFLGGLTCPP
jgi:hypothetical protein